jgi:hypothetical protein
MRHLTFDINRFMLPDFIATTRALTTAEMAAWLSIYIGVIRSTRPDVRRVTRFLISRLPETGFYYRELRSWPCWQFSLLISFELLTIPPPTTAFPFHHDRFVTLYQRRDLSVSIPQADLLDRWDCRHTDKGSPYARRLPDRLGRNEFVILRTGHSPQVALHLSLGNAVTTLVTGV